MTKGPVWVVVADGGMARFLEREHALSKLSERQDLTLHADQPEQPSERPARVHDRFGPARHSIEPRQLPRRTAAEEFLKLVAGAVNAAADAGSFNTLVLCAPARPLGLLREHLSAPALQRLGQVLVKDYVKASVEDIDRRLREAQP
jgi:protein required for attachment to host cells